MKAIIIAFCMFSLLVFSCKKKETIKKEPECGKVFYPSIYDSQLSEDYAFINIPEKENSQYYTICNDELTINFLFNIFGQDKLIIPTDCFENKTYLGITSNPLSQFLPLDNNYVLVPSSNKYYFEIFSNTPLSVNQPFEISIAYDLRSNNSYNEIEIKSTDLKIIKFDPFNPKVLEVMPTVSNSSENSGKGIITSAISTEGCYAIGIQIEPKFTGNNTITAKCSGLVNKTIIYNNALKGAWKITEPIIGTYTAMQVDFSGSDYTIGGDAWIRFVGYGVGTYNLNSSNTNAGNVAQFGYKENNVLKWFKTTGNNGSIIITKYEDVGGVIEGTLNTTSTAGGITNTNKNVNIEASFKVKRIQ